MRISQKIECCNAMMCNYVSGLIYDLIPITARFLCRMMLHVIEARGEEFLGAKKHPNIGVAWKQS